MTIEIFGRPLLLDTNKNLSTSWWYFEPTKPGTMSLAQKPEWMLELDWEGLNFYVRIGGDAQGTFATFRRNFHKAMQPMGRTVTELEDAVQSLLKIMVYSQIVVDVANAQTKGFTQTHVKEIP